MSRHNDRELGVANRDTWTVKRVRPDGSVDVIDGARNARLPRSYVEEHTHLAYAATEYGVQGATVDYGHGIVTDSSSAQAVYVSATRGREHNAVHMVAGDVDEARALFADALRRESGDRGIEAARDGIERDLDGIVLKPAVKDIAPDIRAERMASEERLFAARTREWKSATAAWKQRHPGVSAEGAEARLHDLENELSTASTQAVRLEQTAETTADEQRTRAWGNDYQKVHAARDGVDGASVFRRRAAEEAHETARRDFIAKHGHEPTAEPPAQLREKWRRAAAAPGKDDVLDASRRRAAEIRKQLDELRRDPVPQPPAKPKAGTPEQEAGKDARYQQRKAQRAQDRDRDQHRVAREPERRPAPKSRGPEL